jgi:hypothetical protein
MQTMNLKHSPKFLKIEANKNIKQSKKKKFIIDSSDLSNFLVSNYIQKSNSNTPKLKNKFRVVNKQLEQQIQTSSQQVFLSGYPKTPQNKEIIVKSPVKSKYMGIFFLTNF